MSAVLRAVGRLARRRRAAVICTMALDAHRAYLDYARPRMDRYAERHGYDVVVRTRSLCPSRPASWSKILLARELMDRYEFVFWVDADTLLVDVTRDVRDDCTPRPLNVVEHHYDGGHVPNMGVFGMWSSEASRALLRLLWDDHRYINHNWWENAALLDLIGYRLWPTGPERYSPHRSLVGFIPNDWNSIEQDPSPRPALLHYAGKSHDERMARFAEDAARAPV